VSKSTTLSTGTINGADLLIELVEPSGHPSVVRISWPTQPSLVPPTKFTAVAADLTRLIASASIRLTPDQGTAVMTFGFGRPVG
jgi:hypothetical protein